MTVRILRGDCRAVLAGLPAESAHCVVTSPPYWGLRDYQIEPTVWGGDPECEHEWGEELLDRSRRSPGTQNGSLTGDGRYQAEACRFEIRSNFCARCGAWRGAFGLEPDWRLYVEHAVEVFRAVHRVLRPDGTVWLNLGDSYATGAGKVGERPGGGAQGDAWAGRPALGATSQFADRKVSGLGPITQPNRMPQPGLKAKDLCGMPWRVAFALQANGWYLRQDIIWSKPNPMPESVRDRCTKAHEYLFLLSKSERYYFDQDAIMEPVTDSTIERLSQPTLEQQEGSWRIPGKTNGPMKAALPKRARAAGNKSHKYVTEYEESESEEHRTKAGLMKVADVAYLKRNRRSVWEVTTQPFSEAHFATFPPALIKPCILAGCPKGGTVLDPFGGAGTVGLVADRLGRDAVLVELKPEYADMAERRIKKDAGLFADVAAE